MLQRRPAAAAESNGALPVANLPGGGSVYEVDIVDGTQPLAGRVALLTGGTAGIGLAAARDLARLGARVILVGRRDPGSVAAALVAEGLAAVGVAGDVRDLAGMRALSDQFGAIDILVCAAGVMSERTAKTLRTTDEEWRRVLSTNLDGVFGAVAAFAPGMAERRSGRIITLSACLGRFSGPGTAGGLAPYRISKAAVNALTKNLAAELGDGKRGVFVDAVCPGHCRTEMGGPLAPRSAEEGADTVVWLATRPIEPLPATGLLWEDRQQVPW